jgi:hypothetical protein
MSWFLKKTEENPEGSVSRPRFTLPRVSIPPLVKSHGTLGALTFALVVVLVYGVYERSVAARSSAKSAEAAMQLQELNDARAQIQVLSAKLDQAINAQNTQQQPIPQAATDSQPGRHAFTVIHPTGHRQKPDPRWKKVQDQLDEQEQQLDAQSKQIESTRQELASARTDLEGSIAKNHDELVILEKKGERSYFEFDLEKSKNFRPVGPVGVSLRKANTKSQFADLKLMVEDRELSKKHLNLYEPVIFYPSEERTPVQLVINGISKNHIHGYISSPKYRASELQAGNGPSSGSEQANARPKLDTTR